MGVALVSLIEAGDVQYLNENFDWKSDLEKAKTEGEVQFFAPLETKIRKLHDHLKTWEEEVNKFRLDFPAVNAFTMKQCLVLQRYLYNCTLLKGKTLPVYQEDVFTLLSCVSDEVTSLKIKECLFAIHASIPDHVEQIEQAVPSNVDTNFTRFSVSHIEDFIERMQEDFDFPEEIVLASLIKVDITKEGNAIKWCRNMMKDDIHEDELEELRCQARKELQKQKEYSLRYDERSIKN